MSSTRLNGGCHCGNIQITLELSREPGGYNPRACDCDFCTKHSAAYLSDPQGSVNFRIKDESRSAKYRQGSGQAESLICTQCGVMVGVIYRDGARLIGAVNAKAIGGGKDFGPEQPVSPKTLSESEKIKRWQAVWFPSVTIASG